MGRIPESATSVRPSRQDIIARTRARNEKLLTKKRIISRYLKQISSSQANQPAAPTPHGALQRTVSIIDIATFSIPEYIFVYHGAEDDVEIKSVLEEPIIPEVKTTKPKVANRISASLGSGCLSKQESSPKINKADPQSVPSPINEDNHVLPNPPSETPAVVEEAERMEKPVILETTIEKDEVPKEVVVVVSSDKVPASDEVVVSSDKVELTSAVMTEPQMIQHPSLGRIYVGLCLLCLVAAVYSHPTIKVVLLGQVQEPSIKRSRRHPTVYRGLPNQLMAFFVPVYTAPK